ncbi:MAG TPA: RtcB family protein [Candidatus Kapabacteria bacterium]|nr:RtcB family protein [Candidatus Kapabacteria bacterium]HPO62911.1 RtcB family protein [Candidatus Kapabacteria bacterium]
MEVKEFIKLSDVLWEIPVDFRKGMQVPARVFANEELLVQAFKDRAINQLINVTFLPGIQETPVVMPDIHEGYGFPIGAVAATDLSSGVISPGGIGYDINCGVRLLKSNFSLDEIKSKLESIASEIYSLVPSGVGKSGNTKLNDNELNKVLNYGCKYAETQGWAHSNDLDFIESNGSMTQAESDSVSKLAKDRGRNQLGTMGAGNHFVEINYIDKIFDEEAAKVFGLYKNQIVIQIHTGSRGLGHQVATDYLKQMVSSMKKYEIELPDRELAAAPIDSDDGRRYFAAMAASANYAWTNRQLITWEIREAWKNVFGKAGKQLDILYDVAHNIAKIEEHTINGKTKKVLVHRKGSTRAFPAGNAELPPIYRSIGQPVLIPGSMGTASYVLVGSNDAMELSFASTCHGAGRLLSRTAAMKKINGDELKKELNQRGIVINTASVKGLAEEAPDAYKDVNSVVNVVERAGIAKIVAKLKPLAVIKG